MLDGEGRRRCLSTDLLTGSSSRNHAVGLLRCVEVVASSQSHWLVLVCILWQPAVTLPGSQADRYMINSRASQACVGGQKERLARMGDS